MDSVETLATDIRYIREGIDAVRVQATRTNGRVTELERGMIVLRVVLWTFSALGVPTLLMLINQGISQIFS